MSKLCQHYADLIAAYKALTEADQYVTISCLPETAEEEEIIWHEVHRAGLVHSRTGISCNEYQAAKYKGDFTLHFNRIERDRLEAENAQEGGVE